MGTFNSPSHRLPLLNQQTTDQNYGHPTTRLALNNGQRLPLVLGSRESQATGRSVTKALKQAERNSASSVQCDRQGSRESLCIGRSVTNQSRQRGIQHPMPSRAFHHNSVLCHSRIQYKVLGNVNIGSNPMPSLGRAL